MPERGQRTALLVIDMLNSYEHDDAEQLVRSVRDAVPCIAALIGRARTHDVPIVYVNDNYGDWNSSSEELARHAMPRSTATCGTSRSSSPAMPWRTYTSTSPRRLST